MPNSAAKRADLKTDRIITKVNGYPVTTPADFYREMDKAAGPIKLSLQKEIVPEPVRPPSPKEAVPEETVTLDAK